MAVAESTKHIWGNSSLILTQRVVSWIRATAEILALASFASSLEVCLASNDNDYFLIKGIFVIGYIRSSLAAGIKLFSVFVVFLPSVASENQTLPTKDKQP